LIIIITVAVLIETTENRIIVKPENKLYIVFKHYFLIPAGLFIDTFWLINWYRPVGRMGGTTDGVVTMFRWNVIFYL